ncbi:MAG: AMP-binding protein [Balneolia bacterium]|nr:AMP-binding protein [Balneolia bacterium]
MKTLVAFVEGHVKSYSDKPYMWEKVKGTYKPTTYAETLNLVRQFAAGLMSLGVEKGQRIALLSEGRNRWIISELGILFTGAINVPLSVKLTPKELEFRLKHSDAEIIVVSKRHKEKVDEIRHHLPDLKQIIVLDELDSYQPDEMSFKKMMQLGKTWLEKNEQLLNDRKESVQPGDIANISYTSGTTADPKGIMLTHRNYTANVEQALTLMHIPSDYKTLLILPLDHSFAHTAAMFSFMSKGASLAMIEVGETMMETLRNIPKNIKEIQPDLLMSVPALAKNFRKNIESAIREKGPKVEKLFNNALGTAYKYNQEGYNKRTWDVISRAKLFVYDKILFSKIRENFGGKLKFFIGGGALLDIELQRFFYAIGMPMFQGYGLSEATPIISSNSLANHKLGSSGKLVGMMDLRILDDAGNEQPVGEKGEIVIRGENVMKGYWKNEEATKETIKDGWLYTGDLGFMDADGYLHVLGRFKSLLIASDGEKYSPESIEESLTDQSSIIEQVMLHNDQDPYTTGLIFPYREGLIHRLKREGVDPKSDAAIDWALELVQSEVDAYKKNGRFEGQFPERWLPSAIGVLPEGFNEENGLMNSTMKMVRPKINAYHASLMQYLYEPEAKKITNPQNRVAMKKLLQGQKEG